MVVADGRRITSALDGDAVAGDLVRRQAEVAALRDISVLEPDIEDVVARLYTGLIGAPVLLSSPPRSGSRMIDANDVSRPNDSRMISRT